MLGASSYTTLVLTFCAALPVWYWMRRRSKDVLPFPPGPKRYPFIGSFLRFPTGVPLWEGLEVIAKRYATDVLYFNARGKHIIILSSPEAISELLDQRSAIYSDRSSTPMLDLIGIDQWSLAHMQYGPRWRTHRKLLNEFFNISAVKRFDVNQARAVSDFLVRLHEHPTDFREHIHHLTASLPLSISYGIRANAADDKFIRLFEKALAGLKRCAVPGAFLVDAIPSIRYLPSWFPGVRFHGFAQKVREDTYNARHLPLEHLANTLKSGGGIEPSIASTYLDSFEDMNKRGFDKEIASNVASIVYIGMSETTNVTLSAFFLAMTRNTDVMRAAQRQLDHVLGGDRLPVHSDISDLPYIVAIAKETFRWAPAAPIGGVHRLIEDDVYRGMFIPGGAIIAENLWAIFYNEAIYPDPRTYDPTRFLDKGGRIDPSVMAPESRVFGSGRRVCPGRHFAIRLLHLAIARILTVFDILPPVDEHGHPRIPEAKFDNAIICCPKPFECVIKPRSEKAIKLIVGLGA